MVLGLAAADLGAVMDARLTLASDGALGHLSPLRTDIAQSDDAREACLALSITARKRFRVMIEERSAFEFVGMNFFWNNSPGD